MCGTLDAVSTALVSQVEGGNGFLNGTGWTGCIFGLLFGTLEQTFSEICRAMISDVEAFNDLAESKKKRTTIPS